ncbi:MAG: glutathione peroxidase [Candidatus Omnitrophica bacterium]|nr:glutathione peroxidase [Candidatus Omnitrophota bacterium]
MIGLLVLCLFLFVRRGWTKEVAGPSGVGSVYDFKVKTIEGSEKSLGDYKGKVLLIVNTASRCGFTPQYTGLEKLYERYKDRGFIVLAFPANDFMGQEPGDNGAIKQFCELTYRTSFPLFSKISVRGAQMAPLYQYLTTASGFQGNISWNFNKFLINRKGQVIARFGSKTDPMDPALEEDVLKALAE